MKNFALSIMPLLIACTEEPTPSASYYDIFAIADFVRTTTVPPSSHVYSVLVEDGVEFETMACTATVVNDRTWS